VKRIQDGATYAVFYDIDRYFAVGFGDPPKCPPFVFYIDKDDIWGLADKFDERGRPKEPIPGAIALNSRKKIRAFLPNYIQETYHTNAYDASALLNVISHYPNMLENFFRRTVLRDMRNAPAMQHDIAARNVNGEERTIDKDLVPNYVQAFSEIEENKEEQIKLKNFEAIGRRTPEIIEEALTVERLEQAPKPLLLLYEYNRHYFFDEDGVFRIEHGLPNLPTIYNHRVITDWASVVSRQALNDSFVSIGFTAPSRSHRIGKKFVPFEGLSIPAWFDKFSNNGIAAAKRRDTLSLNATVLSQFPAEMQKHIGGVQTSFDLYDSGFSVRVSLVAPSFQGGISEEDCFVSAYSREIIKYTKQILKNNIKLVATIRNNIEDYRVSEMVLTPFHQIELFFEKRNFVQPKQDNLEKKIIYV
jgi:hypothetical protein